MMLGWSQLIGARGRAATAIAVVVAGCVVGTSPPAAATPPVNDNLASAVSLPGPQDPSLFSTAEATTEALETSQNGCVTKATIWFKFTAAAPTSVTLDTESPATNFTTVLAVWSGNGSYPLTPVACDDGIDHPASGSTARVSFTAAAGATYYIQVGGYVAPDQSYSSGTVDLTSTIQTIRPANDYLVNATPLPVGHVAESTVGASTDAGETAQGDECTMGATVWFTLAVPAGQTVTIGTDNASTDFDTVLSVWRGTGTYPLSPVTCNDDIDYAHGNLRSRTTFTATTAATYYVEVGGALNGPNANAAWGHVELDTMVTGTAPSADLGVALTAGTRTSTSSPFQLDVSNAGPDPAYGVKATLPVPSGTSYGGAAGSDATCAVAGGLVTCDFGSVTPSGTERVTIELTRDSGVDQVTLTASVSGNEPDPASGNNTASATSVAGNQPATARPDRFRAVADQPQTIAAPGVLDNDTDPEGDPQQVVLDQAPLASQGTLELHADGSFVFTPTAGFIGNATFTYHLEDAAHTNRSGSAVVTVDVYAALVPETGAARPYPLVKDITAAPGQRVADVDVILTGLTHESLSDLDVLLVAPGGANTVLMSDTGGLHPVDGVDLTFDDEAPEPLGDAAPPSGSYRPTDLGGTDAYPAPAPVPGSTVSLGSFDGIDPNGQWKLYIADDVDGGFGSLRNWSIYITYQAVDCGGLPATIVGTDGDDHIDGTDGDDVIAAGAGNDQINGGGGDDTVCGEDGNDVIRSSLGDDLEFGGTGDDQLLGAWYDGSDRLYGEAGRDTLEGGSGADQIYGGDDIDRVTYADHKAGVTIDLTGKPCGNAADGTGDTIFQVEWATGSDHGDKIHGTDGMNSLDGGFGDDQIWAGGKTDLLYGGPGNDDLDGGLGGDIIDGGDSAHDIATYDGRSAGVQVRLGPRTQDQAGRGNFDGPGEDLIKNVEDLRGTPYDDRLVGDAGPNFILGGSGDDVIDGVGGKDSLSGDRGSDKLFGYQDRDDLDGGDGNDYEYGGDYGDTINGGAGRDNLNGGNDSDVVHGDGGDDYVAGGYGADYLYGDVGFDHIDAREYCDRTCADAEISCDRTWIDGPNVGPVLGEAAIDDQDHLRDDHSGRLATHCQKLWVGPRNPAPWAPGLLPLF